jgi:hypothetical protein
MNEKEHSSEEVKVMALAERTANLFCACANNLSQSAETIMQSCATPGTKGAAARQMLEVKAAEYRALSDLLHSAARRFLGAAGKIDNGFQLEEAAKELKTYAGFLSDQLGKEAEEADKVLSAVRSSGASQQETEKQG